MKKKNTVRGRRRHELVFDLATHQQRTLREQRRLLVLAGRFLHYSLSPVDYDYGGLTDTERNLITPADFRRLMKWLRTQPCPDTVEAGDACTCVHQGTCAQHPAGEVRIVEGKARRMKRTVRNGGIIQ